jgi:GNAT superfamily N-acetyltransferase
LVFDVVEQQLAELVELDAVALGILDQRSVVGVALTYANGLRSSPPRATLHEAPPFLLAGPGPGSRGAWVDSVMKRHHPHHEHLLFWYLAADPSLQRQGIGRALLDHIRSETTRARRPICLDTIKPENVPYYESQGYRQISHARLLHGATVWFMHHDTPAVADDQPG